MNLATPLYEEEGIMLYFANALTGLRGLDSESVQTVVTSPPYWGLRDYKTEAQVWDAKSGCNHEFGLEVSRIERRRSDRGLAQTGNGGPETRLPGLAEAGYISASQGAFCHCGAWRGSLGLEPTPELYVEHLIMIFREVRRVLKKDGTLFLNLGDSFASSSMNPIRSRAASRVPSCGNDDRERQGLMGTDSSYYDLCDVCRGVLLSRTGSDLQPVQSSSLSSDPSVSAAPSGFDSKLHGVSPLGGPVSTMIESSSRLPGACCHCANCGACLAVLHSSSRDGRLCARKAEYINGNGRLVSDGRNPYMDALGMACLNYTLKPKDLLGIPWRVAFALQADGWWLRSDIIWAKPNPMPESVMDRPTRAHEYLFLLTKSARYYYDAEAIKERGCAPITKMPDGWDTGPGGHGSYHRQGREKGAKKDKQHGHSRRHAGFNDRWDRMSKEEQCSMRVNRRSVWTIPTQPYHKAHFATFPEKLVEPCILAGSRSGDCILDPFAGSGTTLAVAKRLGRHGVGIELNSDYCQLAADRIQKTMLAFHFG